MYSGLSCLTLPTNSGTDESSNGVPAQSPEVSSSSTWKPAEDQAASFPPAAEWSPQRAAQLQENLPAKASAPGNPGIWGEGLTENEWDDSKQEAKPDPLGAEMFW